MERVYKGIWVATGTGLLSLIGGYDYLFSTLVLFMVLDFATGVAAAAKECKLDSRVSGWGFARKLGTVVVIILAVRLDALAAGAWPGYEAAISHGLSLRTAALFSYVSGEGLSILENLGRMKVPLPGPIKKALIKLGELSEGGTAK